MSLASVTPSMESGLTSTERSGDFGDEQMVYYSQLLTTDAQAVVKAVQAGELPALHAILLHHSHEAEFKLWDGFYLELLTACCAHCDKKKYMQAVTQLKSADKEALAEYETTINLATHSLSLIGSNEMQKAIDDAEDLFAPVILRQWENLFSFMTIFYETSRQANLDAGKPRQNPSHSSLLCNAITALFSCKALGMTCSIKDPGTLLESAWAWCLYGHTRHEDDSNLMLSKGSTSPVPGVRCLSTLFKLFHEREIFISAAVKGSSTYGGIKFVARFLTDNFLVCAQSQKMDDIWFFGVLFGMLVPGGMGHSGSEGRRLRDDLINAYYEQGGMRKMIEALSFLAKSKRAELFEPRNAVGSILVFAGTVCEKSRRHIERAARDGIFELFLDLDPDRGDVTRLIRKQAAVLLDQITSYFVYYSVIGAYAAELRRLTDGPDPKERRFTKGRFFKSWQKMKRLLLERYCVKSFFDSIIAPDGLRYCNSCGKTECDPEIPYSTCGNCRRVLYCSKQCQLTDWKEDGHKEDCQAKIDTFNNDIPFLCFFVNMLLTPRWADLQQLFEDNTGTSLELESAVFQIWFSTIGNRPMLSVSSLENIEGDLSLRLAIKLESGMDPKILFRGELESSPPLMRDAKTGTGTISSPGAQIMVEVPDGQFTYVIRYIYFQTDLRALQKLDEIEGDESYYSTNNEVEDIRAIPRSVFQNVETGVLDLLDSIDYIYCKFYAPAQDPWALHLRESGPGKHILDFVDDFVKENYVSTLPQPDIDMEQILLMEDIQDTT